MRTSPQGIVEIAGHEGVVLGPYRDSVGVWTVYVGHTAGAGSPDPATIPRRDTRRFTEAEADAAIRDALALFADDLQSYESRVERAIKVPLAQHQFDALVSFDFNTGGILRARLTAAINAGDMDGDGFMGWTRPKEIIGRRRAEQTLFRTGRYTAGPVTLWDAHGDGRLSRRGALPAARVLALMGQPVVPAEPEPAPPPAPAAPTPDDPAALIAEAQALLHRAVAALNPGA